ncbi:hypothetical protein LCGC14_2879780 [marine sediment metagenome]|uniref:Uncharacterized protein n=1 Tax=marine sediment metagenome TaxID=412755 RepID=A0A0F8Y0E5_9ZZZZ
MKFKLFLPFVLLLLVPTVLALSGGSSNNYSTDVTDYFLLEDFIGANGNIDGREISSGGIWRVDAGTPIIQNNSTNEYVVDISTSLIIVY